MKRKTVVVDGPLAFHMRRIAAARASELGTQIFAMPMLAARLAGGYLRPADQHELDDAIRAALDRGGLQDLQKIRDLPGMTRAVSATLHRLWEADISLCALTDRAPRWSDLAVIEGRVRSEMRQGALIARDLRDRALARAEFAPAVLGSVQLWNVPDLPALWRPLITAIGKYVEVVWRNPSAPVDAWFDGAVVHEAEEGTVQPIGETCANPRTEVIEALRWARQLVASGTAAPAEVAICATTTAEWDADFLALAKDSQLPIHFSHGIPVLASWEGQACAALADILLNGVSQTRVRRFLGYAARRAPGLRDLPSNWAYGLQPSAALHTLAHWTRALDDARTRRPDDVNVGAILLPHLALMDQGVDAAHLLSETLPPAARALWQRALQHAPASAIEYSLQALRTPHDSDPGACIAWCPARHLESAPRPWVRMLGLTGRSWPRPALQDPLLPPYLLAASDRIESIRERDERAFHSIARHATRGAVLVRSRRGSQGTLQSPSPLLPHHIGVRSLRRARVPQHAFNLSDRLLARPSDLKSHPVAASAYACWRAWQVADVTVHDGLTSAGHPAVAAAIDSVQSATSLHRMLRDPISFMWRYALGWRSPEHDDQPLSLDFATFGELVHVLIKGAVDILEPSPGLIGSNHDDIRAALSKTRSTIRENWPLVRVTPPSLLWDYTLALAFDFAFRALTLDESFESGTRSWSEVDFGWSPANRVHDHDLPWRSDQTVCIPGTNIRIRGTIDRVDLRKDGDAVRVTDYKTGTVPANPNKVLFGRGGELQRVIYAVAAQALLPNAPKIVARLVYLAGESPQAFKIGPKQVEEAISECALFLNSAEAALRRGHTLPGPDASSELNELRIALPAALERYLIQKSPAVRKALGREFTRLWGNP